MLPSKKSKHWIGVFILYALVIFIGFIATRHILGSKIFGSYMFNLLGLSIFSALIPCIAGYLGKRLFFIIYTFCVIAGILYMFYVVLANIAPGWGELTSIVSFLFMVLVGVVLALVTEIIVYIVKRKK